METTTAGGRKKPLLLLHNSRSGRSRRRMNAKGSRPTTTWDLLPSELAFLAGMCRLGHGRYECLKIHNGELVLAPWPIAIRDVKFGAQDPGCEKELSAEFRLSQQLVQLFEYIRNMDAGEIRVLVIKSGMPFAMQIVQESAEPRGAQ